MIGACASPSSPPTVTELQSVNSESMHSENSDALVSFPTKDGGLVYGDMQPSPGKDTGPQLIIASVDDANDGGLRLPAIREALNKMEEPKELIAVNGSAHAQFLFRSDQGERVMQEILRFLSEP